MLMSAAASFGAGIDVGGPGRGVPGVVGEADDGLAEAVVAGPSEGDAAGFAGGVGDGSDAGFGGELVFGEEALADIAEFGEDLRSADSAGAGEGHDDPAVGELGDGVLDARGEPGNLADEHIEAGGERANEFALGIGFGFLGEAIGGGAQPGEELGRRAASAIAVLGEEAGEALLAEARCTIGGWIAANEGDRDRAVDGGEDGAGAGPEAVERLRSWLASASRWATRSSRPRTSARSARMSSEAGVSGRKRCPSVRRMSASI